MNLNSQYTYQRNHHHNHHNAPCIPLGMFHSKNLLRIRLE